MKKALAIAVVAIFSVTSFTAASASAATTTKQDNVKRTVKQAVKKPVKHSVAKKNIIPNSASVIPANAMKWSCASNGSSFYTVGDVKKDQELTMYYGRESHKLSRRTTTTGADRFSDKTSGWDLLIMPSKTMLLQDHSHTRVADECKTQSLS